MALTLKESSTFEKVDKVVFKIVRFVSYLATVFLLLIMLIAVVNVLGEKLQKIGFPVTGVTNSSNWVQFLNVGVVYLTCAYVTLERGQTSVDLILKHYPKTVQRILNIFANLVGCVVVGYIAWRGTVKVFAEQLSTNARINASMGTSFPQWPFGLIYSVGMWLLAFSLLWAMVRLCAGRPAASMALDLDEVREGIMEDLNAGENAPCDELSDAASDNAVTPSTQQSDGKDGEPQ